MANKVIMPKSGMAMETGKIVKWLKKEGDIVEIGEPLLEIETDKVSMEVEATVSGVLLKILAHEGEEVPVVQTIAYIGEQGEAIPELETAKPAQSSVVAEIEKAPAQKIGMHKYDGERIAATPAAKRIAKEKGISLEGIMPSGSRGQVKSDDVQNVIAKKKATPLANAIASDMGIDISNIDGTGFAKKVTKADVLAAGTSPALVSRKDELIPHSTMRSVIAKRMLQSHLEIPPVTQNCVVDVTDLMELRKKINTGETHITINDFVIMAVSKALKEHPRINASYTEEGLLVKKHINIGIAVALPEGLIVPVIKDADMLTLKEISAKARELADKARQGRLLPDECLGGTFTISNLGIMGVTSFTPIINQPEIAILGVCAAEQKLEMDENGNIIKKIKMGLSLTYDHRCIDGAQAAAFSNRIVELLQNPVSMIF